MAGNPRHFQSRAMSLFPPSYFVHKPPARKDDVQETKEDTGKAEGQALKVENDRLREQVEALLGALKESDATHQQQHPLQVEPSPCGTIPLAEFVRMKSQLQECIEMLRTENSSISDRLLNMERLRLKEREVAQQRVEELVCQHEAARQSLLEELDRLQQEKERFVQSKEAEVAQALSQTGEEVRHLAEQLDWANAKVMEKEGALRLAVKEKEEAAKKWEVESRQQEVCLKAKESEVQNLAARMEEMKRSHEEQVMDCLGQLTRFRSCTGCDCPPEGDFPWWQEREELLSRTAHLTRDSSSLSKELELVHVRLEALTEMLALQEAGLSSGDPSGPLGQAASKGAQQQLLTRWREKVFALLVQLKSHEIGVRAMRDEFQREKAALVEEHSRLGIEKDLLRCGMEDKAAQLEIEQERNCSLVERLDQRAVELLASQQQAAGLEKVVRDMRACVGAIPTLMDHHRSIMHHVQTRLVGYEQRLGFATKRLQTIEVLCRQQRSRLTASVLTQTEDMDEEGLGAVLERPDDLQTLSRWELVSEVVQLSKERQALCDHISKLEKSHKAATAERGEQWMQERLAMEEKLCQCENEMCLLRTRCSELEQTVVEVERAKAVVVEEKQQLSQDKLQLVTSVDKKIQDALTAERQRTVEEIAAMEEQLNAARREQAKASVALQQSRREAVRERERLLQGMELERERLEGEVEGCKAKLSSVMAERNLLMSNIRGEGLLQKAFPTHLQQPRLPSSHPEVFGATLKEPPLTDSASSLSSCTNQTYTIERPSELDFCDQFGLTGAEVQPSVSPPSKLPQRVKDADLVMALEDIQRLSTGLLQMEKNS